MKEIVYLSLGSNTCPREEYLQKAVNEVSNYPDTELLRVSSIYETEPVDVIDEHATYFLNMCLALKTSLKPFHLLELVRKTEQGLGRNESKRYIKNKKSRRVYHSRTIDIDILLFGERIIYTKDLIVPHPLLHERGFVLVPLAEIAGAVSHPLFMTTINELKMNNRDKHVVRVFKKIKIN